MLAKGPVAPALAAVIIVIFAVVKGEHQVIWRTLWIPGILVFCAVGLPWYIAVQMRNPNFFRVFILQHNLARFRTDLYHHSEPFWFYLPVVLLGLVPWTMFVVEALLESIRRWRVEGREMFRSEDDFSALLVIWLIVPVLFFSVSASKLPGYIVPALPAGTLLLAEYVRRHASDNVRPRILPIVLHSTVAASLVVPALMLQYIVFQHRLPWGRALEISLAFAMLLGVGMVVTLYRRFGLRVVRFVTLVPVVLALSAALRIGAPALDATLSARPLAEELSKMENRTLPLAVLGVSRETQSGLQFYRNQAIARYELGQAPAAEHLVIAPAGSQIKVAKWTVGRRVTYLGSFAPQGLDYYWVEGKKIE
jgi:4-amino-4-deoxy-L-arabinose transferase-like glycosyltransferase